MINEVKIKTKKPIWKKWWFWLIMVFVIIIIVSSGGGEKKKTEPENNQTTNQEVKNYPSFTEETMNRDCVLSCAGGDEVVLWDKPASSGEGARLHGKVPCGTKCFAFNKYYNEKDGTTFYAVNTYDPRAENAYGWITEDLVTWLDE